MDGGANVRPQRTRRRATGTSGSAESRKRRARHVIWDMEDEIARLQGVIAEEEQRQRVLQRQLTLYTHAVKAREDQAQRIKIWGTSPPSSAAISAAPSLSASPHATPLRADSGLGSSAFPSTGCSSVANTLLATGSKLAALPGVGTSSEGHTIGASVTNVPALISSGRQQLVEHYKQAAESLSPMLFMAEGPGAGDDSMQRLEACVNELRTTGAIVKVCNAAAVLAVAQPVAPNLEPASDEHWQAVGAALLLSPQQVDDIVALAGLCTRWQARVARDQASVCTSLDSLLREEAATRAVWRTDLGGAREERKLDLMARAARLATVASGAVLLADELLMGTNGGLLTPIQVARLMVHSYPYVPNSCAIIAAVARTAGGAGGRQEGMAGPRLSTLSGTTSDGLGVASSCGGSV